MGRLEFAESVHTAVWGREEWVISAFGSDPSVVVGGACAGKTLRDLHPDFPLLFKVIETTAPLSVQVHPNEATCRVTGGDPKAEMWCVLSDGPIFAGLRAGTTAAAVAEAVRSGRFEDLLVRHEAHFGDVFYLPGGLVHTIGGGVKLYEVQQSSNTTFRLYDWGRVGADGRPRELHVDRALEAIDYSLAPPPACRSVQTPYFDFSQVELGGTLSVAAGDGFLALYVARGSAELDGAPLKEGASVLFEPGAAGAVSSAAAHLFLTRFTRIPRRERC